MTHPDALWHPEQHGTRPNLLLFVHGFSGDAQATWESFRALLQADRDLGEYDFCFWGYPSTINPLHLITRLFWSDDPNLATLGHGLRTLLDTTCEPYRKIVLAAHSMGGLIVQLFILEEMAAGRPNHLNRLTEVVLFGTPSGGLVKASLAALLTMKQQIVDMGAFGSFIEDLRYRWKRLIDDRRGTAPAPFRLTLVAGMKDKFVPQSSSLDPFPFDEKEIVPGTHTEMMKPAKADDLRYLVLRRRVLRGTPSQAERELILGQDEQVVQRISRVRAAALLEDVDDLTEQAKELLGEPQPLPLVGRALGLALLDHEVYPQAAGLLERYVDFRMPGSDVRPFAADAQALQQLAIALSGAGKITEAVHRLQSLDTQLRDDPETLGILAGRFKRQWLKTETKPQIGQRALAIYEQALKLARADGGRPDQVFYNGINAAYLRFALGEAGYEALALETLKVCDAIERPDYWSEATRGECFLLLGRDADARTAYQVAARRDHAPRHWTASGQQALDILRRRGNPPSGAEVAELFRLVQPDFRS